MLALCFQHNINMPACRVSTHQYSFSSQVYWSSLQEIALQSSPLTGVVLYCCFLPLFLSLFFRFPSVFFIVVLLIVCFVRILSLFGSPFATSPSSCSSVTYAISFQYDIAKNKLHSGLKLNCKSCCLEQVWANRKKCTNVMFVPQGTTT